MEINEKYINRTVKIKKTVFFKWKTKKIAPKSVINKSLHLLPDRFIYCLLDHLDDSNRIGCKHFWRMILHILYRLKRTCALLWLRMRTHDQTRGKFYALRTRYRPFKLFQPFTPETEIIHTFTINITILYKKKKSWAKCKNTINVLIFSQDSFKFLENSGKCNAIWLMLIFVKHSNFDIDINFTVILFVCNNFRNLVANTLNSNLLYFTSID